MEREHRLRRGSQEMLSRARQLRQQLTPAERKLWEMLRAKRLDGAKFYFQRPGARLIADFYCYRARLVVEVDGGVHQSQEEQDQARDGWLRERGIPTLRFSNEQVLERPAEVIATLSRVIAERTKKR